MLLTISVPLLYTEHCFVVIYRCTDFHKKNIFLNDTKISLLMIDENIRKYLLTLQVF